jgi:membrane protein DedA with SNARE-associated domain
MNLEHLIHTYGYAAIFIGTCLEGETILVLGGIAAKLGYLELPWVILCAFAGTILADQSIFFLGRYKGQAVLKKWPAWRARTVKVRRHVKHHRIAIILGFRFLYGLRTVTPFVLGMSRVPPVEFVILNIIAAGVWATLIGVAGYIFGDALEMILGDIRHYQMELMGGIALVTIIIWLARRARRLEKN